MASTLPTFSDLSLNTNFGLPTCTLDPNSNNTLGLNHYSYFSNLGLSETEQNAMSLSIEKDVLLYMTWKEENAAFWLSELYRLASDPVKRLTLIREAYEEQEHFSILVGIIKQLYTDEEIVNFWTPLKEEYDKLRSFEYHNDLLAESIFDYAANEIKVLVYIDQIRKHTINEEFSQSLDPIICDEEDHLEYGPIFIGEELFQQNKLVYRLKLKAYFNEPFVKFVPGHVQIILKEYCKDHNLDFDVVTASMQTTQRHRNFVAQYLQLLYKFGQAFTLIKSDTDFETALQEFGVLEKYQALAQY